MIIKNKNSETELFFTTVGLNPSNCHPDLDAALQAAYNTVTDSSTVYVLQVVAKIHQKIVTEVKPVGKDIIPDVNLENLKIIKENDKQ